MPDQTVSGVTAGDSGGLGRPKTYLATYSAGNLSFDFTASYELPTTLSVAFYFGGQQVISGGAGDQSKLGQVVVANAAQSFAPVGFDSLTFSRLFVWSGAANVGVGVDFEFTESYTPPYPPYAPFSFGGQIVLASVSLGVQTSFGVPTADSRLRIELRDEIDGIPPQLTFGRARVSPQPGLDFLFVDAYTPTSAINTPFYFGGQVVVSTRGHDSSRFGTAKFDAPVTVAPQGFDSSVFGRASLRMDGQNGVGVDFLFTDPYTAPVATDVPFIFPFVSLEGIARISVSAQVRAESAQLSGTAIVDATATAFLKPSAELAAVASVSASATGELTTVEPIRVSGFSSSVFGAAFIDYEIRTITLLPEASFDEYGTATVWYRVREIAPTGFLNYQFPFQQYGTATVTYYERFLSPAGFDFSGVGVPTLGSNTQVIIPTTPIVGEFGSPIVDLFTRYISFTIGLYEGEFNVPRIYNSAQYVQHYTPEQDYVEFTYLLGDLVHLQYGEPYVENRNKTISAVGEYRTRFGNAAEVLNKAVVLRAQGDDLSLFGRGLVAYRIREVAAEGFDTLFPPRWVNIYNRSAVISVPGSDYLRIDAPVVFSNTQWIRGQDIYNDLSLYGTPFVAFRVRYLDLNTLGGGAYNGGIQPEEPGRPALALATQYITPIAPIGDVTLDQMRSPLGGVGVPFVEEKFSILAVRQIFDEEFGTATVTNDTAQLFLDGPDSQLAVGEPFVAYRVRTIDLHREGIPRIQTFPLQPPWVMSVERGIRYISLDRPSNGIPPPRITDRHIVYTDYPQVNPPRVISLLGGGIQPVPLSEGAVVTNFNKTIAPDGWLGVFGTVNISNNGIFPLWDYPSSYYGFGTPALSGRPPRSQEIRLWRTDPVIGDRQSLSIVEWEFGQARLSPWYIICQEDIGSFRPLGVNQYDESTNSYYIQEGPGPYFGAPKVTLQYRQVAVFHTVGGPNPSRAAGERFGDPVKIELKDRYLYPEGIEPSYVAYPEVFPQTLYIFSVDWDSNVFGDTTIEVDPVEEPPFKTVAPAGWRSPEFGVTQIENFHRYVTPAGWDSFTDRGLQPHVNLNSPAGPFPYAPRGYTDVYFYPRGPRPTGWDSALYGNGMVAYRIRHVTPEGWDSFTMTYSIGAFDQRFRVRHLNFKARPTGAEMTGWGEPAVRNAQLRVYPFQIAPPRCGVSHDLTVD